MLRRILVCFTLASALLTTAQNEAKTKLIDQFVEHYNKKEYGLVYAMFSDNMQQKTPIDQIEGLLKGLNTAVGSINKAEFVTKDEAQFSHYKTSFEKGIFDVAFSEDESGKISGFKIVPFSEKDFTRKVTNQLTSVEDFPTTLQTELIFEFCKGFPNQTEVAFSILVKGEARYYGVEMRNDTLFTVENSQKTYEIGSISKVFTATLLAEQVQSGKLSLDDSINDYFDFPFHQEGAITFKSLANHSSGLPRLPSNLDLGSLDLQNPYKDYDEEKLNAFLKNELNRTSSSIGTYGYSNLGAGLLGHVLAKQSGTSYEDLLQSEIAERFGMKNTTSIRDKVSTELIKGLDAKGKETPNWDLEVLSGAGGILSTIEDLTKFTIAHLDSNNKALQLTTQETFKANDKMGVGLGWHLRTSESGKDWVWHNGATGGYSSSLTFNKATQNGVIILSNVSGVSPKMGFIDKLGFQLLESLEVE